MSDTSSNPAHIERKLDQTRSRLSGHLNELQDRLSPGQVLDDLMGHFRSSEGGEFARSLMDSVRANPLPAALTGIGLTWLMAANPRGGATTVRNSPFGTGSSHGDMIAERLRAAEQGVERAPDEAVGAYADRLATARGHAVGLTRNAQESVESFGQRISEALASAKQGAVEGAHDLRDRLASAAGVVGDKVGAFGASAQGAGQSAGSAVMSAAQRAGGAVSDGFSSGLSQGQNSVSHLMSAVTESPVLLGALGLAAGALLGALLPQSDQEEAALGSFAGQARATATGLAQEAMTRGQSVAQTLLQTGRESAEAHGLTGGGQSAGGLVDAALSGKLASGARDVVQEVLKAGDDAVRKEVINKG